MNNKSYILGFMLTFSVHGFAAINTAKVQMDMDSRSSEDFIVETLSIPYGVESVGVVESVALDSRNPPTNFLGEEAVIEGYCHDSGVPVYVSGRTGMSVGTHPPNTIGQIRLLCRTPNYVKNSPTATSTFTVVPSYLEIKSTQPPNSTAALQISVQLCAVGGHCEQQFLHHEKLIGHGGSIGSEFFDYTSNFAMPSTNEIIVGGSGDNTVYGARVDIFEFTGDINLSSINVGAEFVVIYDLVLYLQSPSSESSSEGFLQDPLDVDSGMSFDPGPDVSLAIDQNSGNQICNAQLTNSAPDERFELLENDTVIDLITNLNWPRCPQGYLLNDQASSDLSDDSCDVEGDIDYSWQQALENAIDANLAMQMDADNWRVPNIKELFSIREAACEFPAINTHVFPAVSEARSWSSTANDVGTAEYFDFGSGQIRTTSQSTPYSLRLVRDSGTPPSNDVIFIDGFE